jgi:predicted nuclease of predicted toxin-antitoxin system
VRLLFDENLSEVLVSALADLYPGSLHVRALGHGGASDSDVWTLAAREGCILFTRDEDFLQLSVVRGAPPCLDRLGQLLERRAREFAA